MKNPKRSFQVGLLLLVFCWQVTDPLCLGAATLQVDSAFGSDSGNCQTTPCKTIAYALSQAVANDLVSVAAGTYLEHITMKEGVSVQGAGWDNTVIDGGSSSSDPVVYFGPGLTAATVLSKVKIQNGGNSITAGAGGGIKVDYSSPIIENTWVEKCSAREGGGVYIIYGSPVFNNVPVWSCQAEKGGGFFLIGDGTVTITGNPIDGSNGTIFGNSATQFGGGIYISQSGLTLFGTRLYLNTASINGGGISISNSPRKIKIIFNDIAGNSAENGGGIHSVNSDQLEISANLIGNSISGNSSQKDGGGASFLQSNGTFQYNYILNNRTLTGLGNGAGVALAADGSGPTIYSNWFEGNTAQGGAGGLSISAGAFPLIEGNTIIKNTACLGGGLFLLQAGPAHLINNIIAQNNSTCPLLTGGIQCNESPARIINNTIADNTGSGITFAQSENILIVNNIISGNSTYGLDRYFLYNTTKFTAHHNDLFSNSSGAYNNLDPGTGDLAVDPLFLGGTTDLRAYYHLQNSSPVAAAGSAAEAPVRDIDGDIRSWAGVSMGADDIPGIASRIYLPLILRF